MQALREGSTAPVLGTSAALFYCEMSGNGLNQQDSSKSTALFGGAISVLNSLLAVTASLIRGNKANEGSAVADVSSYHSLVSLANTTIEKNAAKWHGAVALLCVKRECFLKTTNSTVSFNTAEHGAGVWQAAGGAKMVVMGSEISLNAAARTGGAVHSQGVTEVLGCVLNLNSAQQGGGSIHVGGGSVILRSSLVHSNLAQRGAAGLCTSKAALNVSGTEVRNNTASIDGGGFLAEASCRLDLQSCVIQGEEMPW